MPAGFFSESKFAVNRAPAFSVPRCGACGLLKQCRSPKMPVYGRGERRVLIVGGFPDGNDDRAGKPGAAYLRAVLESYGYDLKRDCWYTYALICHPPRGNVGEIKRIDYCRPNLSKTIAELKPNVIIPLGKYAVRAVIGPAWKSDPGEIGKWAGWQIPMHRPNAWVCPTWAPDEIDEPAAKLWFRKHIKRAMRLETSPWGSAGPPNYEERVERIYDPTAAARRITGMMQLGDFPAVFDYETDRLKPDLREASIVCCSISWEGRTTIAYPWAGAAIDATRRFLESPAPKRGANIKFEDRWTLSKLGVPIKNWIWDTHLAAHVCDNRPGIASVKFQAFVRLGAPLYNEHLSPLLESDGGGNSPNRVRQIDMPQLLLYCGLDALYEWLVSEHQMKELGLCKLDTGQ